MKYQYDFTLNVSPNELQSRLDAFADAGWRVHSMWQSAPDARQVLHGNEPLAVYDVLFERESE